MNTVLVFVMAMVIPLLVAPVLSRIIHHWPDDRDLRRHWNSCAVCGEGKLPTGGQPWLEAFNRTSAPCGHLQPRFIPATYLFLLGSGVVVGLLQASQPWPLLLQSLLMLAVFYPLAVIDLRHLVVEPRLIVVGLAGRFIGLGLVQPELLMDMLGGMLVGAGLFTMVDLIYQTIRHRSGLGEGDAPMLGLIGAFVGWQGILPVVAVSAVAGLLVAPPVLLLRRKPLDTPIPYVPFLAAAGAAVYLLESTQPGWWWQFLAGHLAVWGDLLRGLMQAQ